MNTRLSTRVAVVSGFCLGALFAASPSRGQSLPTPTLELTPGEIAWVNSPIPGVQSAVLAGNIQQPGLYVLRVKIARDARLAPHMHPDVRNTTVLSGEMYFGFGDTFDPDRMKVYPAGAIIAIPANTPHYVWAKTGEVIVQDVGIGPTGTAPVRK